MAFFRSSLNGMPVARAAVKVVQTRRVVRNAEKSMMGERLDLKVPRVESSALWRVGESGISFLHALLIRGQERSYTVIKATPGQFRDARTSLFVL